MPTPNIQGFSKGAFHRPPPIDAGVNSACSKIFNSRPRSKMVRLASDCYSDVVSFVGRLREVIGPAAIAWIVAFAIVHSFDAGVDRRLSHIGNEVLKSPPSLAHGYSATAITEVRRSIRVLASCYHSAPYLISARFALPVRPSRFRCARFLEAAARLASSGAQPFGENVYHFTTVTPTRPLERFAVRLHRRKSYESAKSHSCFVFKSTAALDCGLVGDYAEGSFIHGNIMLGLSEPPASTGGLALYNECVEDRGQQQTDRKEKS